VNVFDTAPETSLLFLSQRIRYITSLCEMFPWRRDSITEMLTLDGLTLFMVIGERRSKLNQMSQSIATIESV